MHGLLHDDRHGGWITDDYVLICQFDQVPSSLLNFCLEQRKRGVLVDVGLLPPNDAARPSLFGAEPLL